MEARRQRNARARGAGRRGDSGARRYRVLLADDHALFLRGLHLVLDQERDIEVVGEAGDGDAAVRLATELAPDVIVMDVRMPGRSGIEATEAIKASQPAVAVLMLTISEDEADLFGSIRAGAAGYLLKEVSIEEIADAIRAVAAGQSRLSPSMASKLLAEFAALSSRSQEPSERPTTRLTDREMQVLRLVSRGLSNREIGRELFISENTVKNHVRNILEKLHLHSRMEAVVYAVREKMLDIS